MNGLQSLGNEAVEVLYAVDVEATEESDSLMGTLTLPLGASSVLQDDPTSIALAYWHAGRWFLLPSTVDPGNGTVTATITHLTRFAVARLFNRPPQVQVQVSPRVLDSFSERVRNSDIPPVEVLIRATDDEPVEVYVTYAIATVGNLLKDEINLVKNQFGLALEGSLIGSSIVDLQAPLGILGTAVRTSLAPKLPKSAAVSETYRLNEISPGSGLYMHAVDLAKLDDSVLAMLAGGEIRIYVTVVDNLQTAPVEDMVIVPVRNMAMPPPPRLVRPGVGNESDCPSTPTFEWEMDTLNVESWRFRLVRGEDVWGSWSARYDWVCTSVGCTDAPSGDIEFFTGHWTPPGPLDNGTYSWAIKVSASSAPSSWNGPETPSSDTLTFEVHHSLPAGDCIYLLPGSSPAAELRVEGEDIIRSEVSGAGDYAELGWVVSRGDEVLLDRMANDEMVLSLRDILASALLEKAPVHVWLSALVRGESRQISNVVEVSFLPSATSTTRAPAFTPAGSSVRDAVFLIDEPSKCRSGPGKEYPIVWWANEGTEVKILGVVRTGGWLYIQRPDDPRPSHNCWIAQELGHLAQGVDQGQIPQLAPPTPNLKATQRCGELQAIGTPCPPL